MQEVLAGRYELGDELGRGGMARVRRARDLRLHRTVAVKLLDGTLDEASRQRFVREARAAASFTHPHAVAVYDAGDDDGQLFLVMELVDGPSLAELVRRGPLPVGVTVRMGDELLQALEAAHRVGIVHRDVKPGNVLIAGDGSAKLADFGIAKRAGDHDLTLAGQVIGTPQYLAPEQLGGEPVTPATDLYAIAVVLYEALAGTPPFHAPTPLAIALAHRDAEVPDVRVHRPDVPERVAEVLRQAMAKVPAERFASAEAMRAALSGAPAGATAVGAVVPLAAAGFPAPAGAPVDPVAAVPATAGARTGGGRPGRGWWWLALVVAALVAGVVIAIDARDAGDDAEDAATATTSPAGSTVATTVAARVADEAPGTDPATVPATAPPAPPTTQPPQPPPAPATVEDLIALVQADPARFGDRADEIRRDLERIAGEGRGRDVERLRERVAEWADDGRLAPDVAATIDVVLAQMAVGDDDDGDDDGGNGGGGDEGRGGGDG